MKAPSANIVERRPESVADRAHAGRRREGENPRLAVDEVGRREREGRCGRAVQVGARKSRSAQERPRPRRCRKARAARRCLRPMKAQLATLVDEAPSGPGWLHEIKYDGYRMLCRIERGRCQIWSRNGKEWTSAFPRHRRRRREAAGEDRVDRRRGRDAGRGRRHELPGAAERAVGERGALARLLRVRPDVSRRLRPARRGARRAQAAARAAGRRQRAGALQPALRDRRQGRCSRRPASSASKASSASARTRRTRRRAAAAGSRSSAASARRS